MLILDSGKTRCDVVTGAVYDAAMWKFRDTLVGNL